MSETDYNIYPIPPVSGEPMTHQVWKKRIAASRDNVPKTTILTPVQGGLFYMVGQAVRSPNEMPSDLDLEGGVAFNTVVTENRGIYTFQIGHMPRHDGHVFGNNSFLASHDGNMSLADIANEVDRFNAIYNGLPIAVDPVQDRLKLHSLPVDFPGERLFWGPVQFYLQISPVEIQPYVFQTDEI